MTVKSKQTKTESPSDVNMCEVLTLQWPSTQITLCSQIHQSAQWGALTITVDKEQVNWCVLEHLFWREWSNYKNRQKKRNCSLRRSTNVKFWKFKFFAENFHWKTTAVHSTMHFSAQPLMTTDDITILDILVDNLEPTIARVLLRHSVEEEPHYTHTDPTLRVWCASLAFVSRPRNWPRPKQSSS